MKIESYRFGSIKIDGKVYMRDVIIFPDKVLSPWWRKMGHNLSISDLNEVIEYNPDLLIIGTGAYGVMQVPDSTLESLRERDIKVKVLKTGEAVKNYNEGIEKGVNVVACLHLTC